MGHNHGPFSCTWNSPSDMPPKSQGSNAFKIILSGITAGKHLIALFPDENQFFREILRCWSKRHLGEVFQHKGAGFQPNAAIFPPANGDENKKKKYVPMDPDPARVGQFFFSPGDISQNSVYQLYRTRMSIFFARLTRLIYCHGPVPCQKQSDPHPENKVNPHRQTF